MNIRNRTCRLAQAGIAIAGLLLGLPHAHAQGVAVNPDREAYFGELHLHTSLSVDAYMNATRHDPEMAYRFAQGEPLTLNTGEVRKISRPLDFAAVTDHSESFGDLALCTTPGSEVYDIELCRGMRGTDRALSGRIIGRWTPTNAKRLPEVCGPDDRRCIEMRKSTWTRVQEAAAQAYKPGKFTSFVGYEYSPVILGPDGATKIHRNVIFRTAAVPDTVFSSFDGSAEDLHKWLETVCREPCRALTIPHNSNASAGQIFWDGRNSDGSPWTKEILDRRARIEPLVEIYQGKGSSECQLGIGLADEECGFENWVRNCKDESERLGCADINGMVRDTIIKGLRVADERGVNPFKLGFIGSTDTHVATGGATEENDYRGQLGLPDDSPEKRLDIGQPHPPGFVDDDGGSGFGAPTKFSPGGLAAVWAESNTREAIWDAMARRETFGTSGTRLRVRFFGGFDLPSDLHRRPSFIKDAYARGVPMGGDLAAAPPGKAPRFSVWAMRDGLSAPLQKIQIIKGWVESGQSRMKIYDVACSDGLRPDAKTGLCPDNQARVDLKTCKINEGKGAAELATTWTDPEFDPDRRAVYYVRVFENPVCRWSTHDANRIKAPLSKYVPPTIKERAWTSPIWYTPIRKAN